MDAHREYEHDDDRWPAPAEPASDQGYDAVTSAGGPEDYIPEDPPDVPSAAARPDDGHPDHQLPETDGTTGDVDDRPTRAPGREGTGSADDTRRIGTALIDRGLWLQEALEPQSTTADEQTAEQRLRDAVSSAIRLVDDLRHSLPLLGGRAGTVAGPPPDAVRAAAAWDLHAVLPGGRADDPRVRRAALDLADRVAALDRRPAPRGQEIDADLRLLRETLVHAEQTGFRAWSLARLRETLEAVTQIAITVGVGLLASAAAAFVAGGPVAPGLLPAAVGLAVAASCDRVRSATADLSGRRTAADRLRTGRDELAGLLDDVVTFLGHLGPTGPPDQRIREAYRQRVYDASLRALTISIGLQAAARSGTGPAADLLPALHRIDRVLREAMRTAAMPEPTTVESVVRARRQLNDLKRPAAPEPPPHRTTERPAQRSTEPPPPRRTAPTVPPGRATGASAGDLVAEIDIVTATIRSVVAADLLAAAAVLADRQNRLVAALYATASPQAEEAMALVAAARGHLATVMDDLTQATGQLEEYARMIGPR